MDTPTLLSPRDVARELAVHPQTIARWEREGFIPPATRRRGRRVYTVADIERLKKLVLVNPEETAATI